MRMSMTAGRRASLVCALLVIAVAGVLPGAASATKVKRQASSGADRAASLVHGGVFARVLGRAVRNGNQRCPRTHSILSDIFWGRLHWTKWGSSGAAGYGVEVHE